MANIFVSHHSQTAEAALQRSFERSLRQLEALTRQLIAGQAAPPKNPFPQPDLKQLAAPPDVPPEAVQSGSTGRTQAEVLGALTPAHPDLARSRARPMLTVQQTQPIAPVTPLDLVQWRYAAIVLGRGQGQVAHITNLAQAAAQIQGQSFLQLYRRDRGAPLPLQPEPQHVPPMRRDIGQLKDLVEQVGPARVARLFHKQQQLTQPIPILFNQQVSATSSSPPIPQPKER